MSTNLIKVSFCFLGLLLGTTLAMAQKPKALTVAFYNVENLFDTINDPNIDDEDFLPQGKMAWNATRYAMKLSRIDKVVNSIEEANKPDIIGLCEIENRKVLTDLVALKGMDRFDIVQFDSPDERGIDVALLYRKKVIKVLNAKANRVTIPSDPTDRTRDVLLASLLVSKDTIHTLVCHFPSRRGGAEKSSAAREAAGAVVRHIADSLLAKNSMAKILIIGDFNDEPSDASISQVVRAKSTIDSATNGTFFNAMAQFQKNGEGSYQYQKQWDMIDQMILSEGLLKGKGFQYVVNSASIFKPEWLQEQNEKYKGAPWRTYAGPKYLGGYSDHFPVYLKLKYN